MCKDKSLSTVPFSGFYGTLHEDNLDRALAQMVEDHNGDPLEFRQFEDLWQTVSWQDARTEYAREYVDALNDEFNLAIEFESLESPREYNFATDRIFVQIGRQEITRIALATRLSALDARIIDKFTSRSGFASFYPNRLKDWPESLADWDHNQIGTLLETYIHLEHGEFDQWAEHDLMESAQCNGVFDSILWGEMSPEGHRLANLAGYLRDREMRSYV